MKLLVGVVVERIVNGRRVCTYSPIDCCTGGLVSSSSSSGGPVITPSLGCCEGHRPSILHGTVTVLTIPGCPTFAPGGPVDGPGEFTMIYDSGNEQWTGGLIYLGGQDNNHLYTFGIQCGFREEDGQPAFFLFYNQPPCPSFLFNPPGPEVSMEMETLSCDPIRIAKRFTLINNGICNDCPPGTIVFIDIVE